MKQSHIEELEQLCNPTLSKEVDKLESIGKPSRDPNLNQFAFNAEANFQEIYHIVPNKPLFKPGCLLGSPDGIDSQEDQLVGMACKEACDMEANVDIGLIKDIEELGTIKRYLSAETVMVTGETIEIQKHVFIRSTEGKNSSNENRQHYYVVRHLIQAINDKQKMFIPTKLFKSGYGYRGGEDLRMDEELDVHMIEHLYNTANPDEVIQPLKILKR